MLRQATWCIFFHASAGFVFFTALATTSPPRLTADDAVIRNQERLLVPAVSRGGNPVRLNLENSLAIAVTNSFELRAIKAQERVRSLSVIERWRDFFPSLTLSYSQTEEARLRETDTRQYRLSAEANLVVYDGGQRSLAFDVVKLQSILARNDYRIALNRLIADVSAAYFEVLRFREAIAIHEKTLEHGRMQLAFISKELLLGEATKFDRMEIEAKVKEIELNLEKARDDYFIGLNRFKLLLKIDSRGLVEVAGDISCDFTFAPLDTIRYPLDTLVDLAVRNRKEVEQADIDSEIAHTKLRISSRHYFPTFSIGVSYSLSDDRYFPRDRGWGVNVAVSSNLWGSTATAKEGYNEDASGNSRILSGSGSLSVLDRLDYRRAIIETAVEAERAKQEKDEMRRRITLEVISGYSALLNGWTIIEIARQTLDLYDAQLGIERMKANLGDSRRYDLIKKEIERGQAALSLLDARVRYLSLSANLEIALGADIGFLNITKYRGK